MLSNPASSSFLVELPSRQPPLKHTSVLLPLVFLHWRLYATSLARHLSVPGSPLIAISEKAVRLYDIDGSLSVNRSIPHNMTHTCTPVPQRLGDRYCQIGKEEGRYKHNRRIQPSNLAGPRNYGQPDHPVSKPPPTRPPPSRFPMTSYGPNDPPVARPPPPPPTKGTLTCGKGENPTGGGSKPQPEPAQPQQNQK